MAVYGGGGVFAGVGEAERMLREVQSELRRLHKKQDELGTLFLSINRRLNAVQELYEMFTGKKVGNE